MVSTVNLLSVEDIIKRLGCSRDHFYKNYRKHVDPEKIENGKCFYDWKAILKRKKQKEKERKKPGRKPLKQTI